MKEILLSRNKIKNYLSENLTSQVLQMDEERIFSLIRYEGIGGFSKISDNDLYVRLVELIPEFQLVRLLSADQNHIVVSVKDEFASTMNVSSSLLYKKTKSLTDQSPTDFIKTIRLNHAVELLHSGKYTVTEVSELCGFASLTYFGIAFRKHFGKSPSEILE